ncbi:MAG: hypothetical protein IH971_09100 [Candidatus Marinimicrobia bacterium]|nr:hypothetical protein [Candidatus Neomarinimicrobiota bacterium]
MHVDRERRVLKELENAKALSMTIRFDFELGDGAITNTMTFNGMPGLLFESEGKQVIKCLPLNQLGIGDTTDEASAMLIEDLVEMLKEALNESTLLEDIKDMLKGKAALIYWDKYLQLAEEGSVGAVSKKVERSIENLELETDERIDPALAARYREYSGTTLIP